MNLNWALVLWPLAIAAVAGLVLISERFWGSRDSTADGGSLERDIRGRTIAALIMGVLIAAVAFFSQYFSAKTH